MKLIGNYLLKYNIFWLSNKKIHTFKELDLKLKRINLKSTLKSIYGHLLLESINQG